MTIENAEHGRLIVLWLAHLVVMIVQFVIPGNNVALGVVVNNSVGLACYIFCFRQIKLADWYAQCVNNLSQYIQRLQRYRNELEDHWIHQEAFNDALSFRVLPQLGVIYQVTYHCTLSKGAADRATEIFMAANECIEAYEAALGPIQDWLGKNGRLSEEWQANFGAYLKELAQMNNVKGQPADHVLDTLVDTLQKGSLFALRATPKFEAVKDGQAA